MDQEQSHPCAQSKHRLNNFIFEIPNHAYRWQQCGREMHA
jgi:hypothetical protein